MATKSYRELNRLRRAQNAFEHLRAYARTRGMTDADAAAREAVERVHSVGLEGEVGGGATGSRREKQPPSTASGGGGSPEGNKPASRSSSAPAKSTGSGAASAVPRRLDDRTKEQLYARAQELGIEGRSNMTKEELIEAIREKQ